MKKFIAIILFSTLPSILFSQGKVQIKFTSTFKKCSQDNIVLEATNLSSTKTFYYYIGVEGLADTGYIPLLSDIKSIGQNGFLSLVPLKPKSKFIKKISKKRILKECNCSIKKVRFYITYFEKQSFESQSKVIWLDPI